MFRTSRFQFNSGSILNQAAAAMQEFKIPGVKAPTKEPWTLEYGDMWMTPEAHAKYAEAKACKGGSLGTSGGGRGVQGYSNRDRSKDACFICGSPKHYSTQCPDKPKDTRGPAAKRRRMDYHERDRDNDRDRDRDRREDRGKEPPKQRALTDGKTEVKERKRGEDKQSPRSDDD